MVLGFHVVRIAASDSQKPDLRDDRRRKMIFEIRDLNYATPATATRAGIVRLGLERPKPGRCGSKPVK